MSLFGGCCRCCRCCRCVGASFLLMSCFFVFCTYTKERSGVLQNYEEETATKHEYPADRDALHSAKDTAWLCLAFKESCGDGRNVDLLQVCVGASATCLPLSLSSSHLKNTHDISHDPVSKTLIFPRLEASIPRRG